MKLFADLLGWVGALMVLLAYAAVSFQKIRPDTTLYQVSNAVGGLFLVVNTVYYHAYPSAFVNVVWIGIALAARARSKPSASFGDANP